jgi:Legume lectin domain
MRRCLVKGTAVSQAILPLVLLAYGTCLGPSSINAQDAPAGRAAGATPGGLAQPGTRHPGIVQVFDFQNFQNVSDFTFNGNARQTDDRYLLVIPSTTFQKGSVWYNDQINLAQGFSTSFSFAVIPSSSSGTTADGLAFLIQNSALTALGADGQDEGYTGITNSLAVEFDTYLSADYDDPNNNHVGIQSCGISANTADHATTCNLGLQPNLPVTIADGKRHLANISYTPGQSGMAGILMVGLDSQVVLTAMVNLSTLLSLNDGAAWVGFTGGTGADFESESILSWAFFIPGAGSGQ